MRYKPTLIPNAPLLLVGRLTRTVEWTEIKGIKLGESTDWREQNWDSKVIGPCLASQVFLAFRHSELLILAYEDI